jgi:hypothetical protein
LQADIAQITDDSKGVPTIRQAKADQDPEESYDPHGDVALHHDGEHILVPDQPAVEERQSRGHEKDQGGTDEYKCRIGGV